MYTFVVYIHVQFGKPLFPFLSNVDGSVVLSDEVKDVCCSTCN